MVQSSRDLLAMHDIYVNGNASLSYAINRKSITDSMTTSTSFYFLSPKRKELFTNCRIKSQPRPSYCHCLISAFVSFPLSASKQGTGRSLSISYYRMLYLLCVIRKFRVSSKVLFILLFALRHHYATFYDRPFSLIIIYARSA